jgi:hypothetical protein
MIPNEEELITSWKELIYDKVDEIDPEYEHLWKSIALGFAIGRGYTLEQAHEFIGILTLKRMI